MTKPTYDIQSSQIFVKIHKMNSNCHLLEQKDSLQDVHFKDEEHTNESESTSFATFKLKNCQKEKKSMK